MPRSRLSSCDRRTASSAIDLASNLEAPPTLTDSVANTPPLLEGTMDRQGFGLEGCHLSPPARSHHRILSVALAGEPSERPSSPPLSHRASSITASTRASNACQLCLQPRLDQPRPASHVAAGLVSFRD